MNPIPADMLLFFFIKMDIDLIDTMLEEDEQYLGLNYEQFITFLKEGFALHQSKGDTALLALKGKFGSNKKPGYSFMGNKSFERFNLIFETDVNNMVINMLSDNTFVFDENSFVIKK